MVDPTVCKICVMIVACNALVDHLFQDVFRLNWNGMQRKWIGTRSTRNEKCQHIFRPLSQG